jgi:signal peptidase I
MNCATRIFGVGLRVCIGAGIAALLLQAFLILGLVAPFRVEGTSMSPTLSDGERIVVDRTAYWFRPPVRWDMVAIRCPHDRLSFCVKRIAGLPGERLRIHDGRVLIDGVPAREAPEIRYGSHRTADGDEMEYPLGEDEFFLLGDNSLRSIDSRMWERSSVRRNSILGRVAPWPHLSGR